jgi:hypothetical protein
MKEIKLTQGYFAMVDDEDYEYLNQWKWNISKSRTPNRIYAARGVCKKNKHKHIYMHRLIMGSPENMQVDHINHNCLDNRKCNLRIVTNAQNTRNKSVNYFKKSCNYKGVTYYRNKWRVNIRKDGKFIHIGGFVDIMDAAKAYDNIAKELFGEYAYLNLS